MAKSVCVLLCRNASLVLRYAQHSDALASFPGCSHLKYLIAYKYWRWDGLGTRLVMPISNAVVVATLWMCRAKNCSFPTIRRFPKDAKLHNHPLYCLQSVGDKLLSNGKSVQGAGSRACSSRLTEAVHSPWKIWCLFELYNVLECRTSIHLQSELKAWISTPLYIPSILFANQL